MYLTDRKNGVPRQLSDHEELELLLETFSKQVEEMVNEAENTHVRDHLSPISSAPSLTRARKQGNVQSTQEIVELILDSNRNALLALDLKVTNFVSVLVFSDPCPSVLGLHRYNGHRNGGSHCRAVRHECEF
jgi:hypothetical protein